MRITCNSLILRAYFQLILPDNKIMKLVNKKQLLFALLSILICSGVQAQFDRLNDIGGRFSRSGGNSADTLTQRNPHEDSITISYRFFDSTATHGIDTSINDFNKMLPVPYTYADLGNIGTPSQSLLFKPLHMQPGWDAGFHMFDPFRYTLEGTKYFTTTRPFTTLAYMMGTRQEQMIDVLHTQNRKELVNFTFEYRLLNAPGAFRNQNSNHSNMRVNISSQSKNKRYSMNLIGIRNSNRGAVNGGIINFDELKGKGVNSPYIAATRIGSIGNASPSPFKVSISSGNENKDFTLYYRHSYDFGQKDSLQVNDSTMVRLFYPRLRFEHAAKYAEYEYNFKDVNPNPDSYLQYYGLIVQNDTVLYKDKWKELSNQLAIYTYPDKKNIAQFVKVFGEFQLLGGDFGRFKKNYYNVIVGGEYRNKTRNQKWDMLASGRFYALGDYFGDYMATANLKRNLGTKIGDISIGFTNVNRTPSFIFNTSAKGFLSADSAKYIELIGNNFQPHSNFPVITGETKFAKENIAHAFAKINVPSWKLSLTGNYYAMLNYAYFTDYFTAKQNTSLFNLLQLGAEKETSLSNFFKWYAEIYVQQKAGNVPVNVPLVLTRNRIAFEGHFYKNLDIATGIEVRYNTPYKPDNYSPFTGNFLYNDTMRISNLPDISYYLNFKIKRFRLFAEAANLNSLSYQNKTFGFNNFSFVRPYYPKPGLWIRVGIFWNFIN